MLLHIQIPPGVLYLIALGSTWHSDQSLLELLTRTKKDRGIPVCMHHVSTFSHIACVFSLTAGRRTIFLLFMCICMFVCLSCGCLRAVLATIGGDHKREPVRRRKGAPNGFGKAMGGASVAMRLGES